MRGKSIKLYIMDENYKNLKSAELSNWVGKAFIGERKHIETLKKLDDLSFTGLYFLILDEDDSYIKKVYIGEADDIRDRLSTHDKKKDWWDKFVVFISKDSNLTKSHVRYLEREVFNIAKNNITTIDIDNKVVPTGSKLPQSDIDDMDEFKDNMLFILKNLGIIDFTKLRVETLDNVKTDEVKNETSPIFVLNIPSSIKNESKKAYLRITEDSYMLLKNSYIRKDFDDKNRVHGYSKLRSKLDEENYFDKVSCDSHYVLKRNVDFKSPSAAAAIARNTSVSGRGEWKLEDGKSLGEYEQE